MLDDGALAAYGVRGAVDQPRARVLGQVARVHRCFAADPGEGAGALLDALIDGNARLDVFYLEAILKLYRKRYDELADAYARVKRLEDLLGAVSAARGFERQASEHELPAPAQEVFARERRRARAELEGALEDEGWLPDGGRVPALQQIVEEVLALDWDGDDDDRRFLAKRVAKELKDLERAELDLDQLQGDVGVHELRRQLRWVALYLQAADGLFALSDHDPLPAYARLLEEPIANSPYARLPVSAREPEPFAVSRSLYVALTKHIAELGDIKDRGERIEAFAHAFLEGGLARDPGEAEAKALEALGEGPTAMKQVSEDARRIWDEIQRLELLKALRKDIKDG